MSEKNNSSIENLEEKINLLLKRFDEQKGIIDSYILRERELKKIKINLNKEINSLEKKLKSGQHNE
jgi:hypothetical protein